MNESKWAKELPAEITVCDENGIIVEMNDDSIKLFEQDGGLELIDTDLLRCHPEESRIKLEDMLQKFYSNSYFTTEKGEKRFFHQSPWFINGKFSGYVEISFQVENEIPHFIRG